MRSDDREPIHCHSFDTLQFDARFEAKKCLCDVKGYAQCHCLF